MDALTGAPVSNPSNLTGSVGSGPLIPGQIVSARVIQALAVDTFLLAVRGQTLVAQSPTPLPLDTVVQLAIRGRGLEGQPISVQLLPLSTTPAAENAPSLPSVRSIAAQLGLPDTELTTQLVMALQRQGVPLRPATVAPLLRLLHEAQEVSAQPAGEDTAAPSTPAPARVANRGSQTLPLPELPAQQRLVTATPPARQSMPATTGSGAILAPESEPAGKPSTVLEQQPATAVADAVKMVPTAATAKPLPRLPLAQTAVHQTQLAGVKLPGISGPTIAFVPVFYPATPRVPPPTPATSAREARESSATTTASTALRPLASATNTQPQSTTTAVRVQTETAAPTTIPIACTAKQPGSFAAVAPGPLLTPAPGPGALAARMPEGAQAPEALRTSAVETRRIPTQAPRTWSPAVVRAVAALPAATRPAAIARLVAAGLPPSAALLPMAAIAVQSTLPAAASLLPLRATMSVADLVADQPNTPTNEALTARSPASGAAAPVDKSTSAMREPTQRASQILQRSAVAQLTYGAADTNHPLRTPQLPLREAVDLAHDADPRPAIRHGFTLAGLLATATTPGETTEPHSLERLLTNLLSRVAAAAANESHSAATSLTAAADPAARTPNEAAGRQPLARLGPHDDTSALASATAAETAVSSTTVIAGSEIAAVREVIARDLLPPQELAEYDRVLALPLAIAGQPLPARLAVTTRRSAAGQQACWMRLDCELSRLGPISVRLGGVEGAPIVITLVARPAAATELAAALPQLTQDLHHLGVEAALRVVAETEGVDLP